MQIFSAGGIKVNQMEKIMSFRLTPRRSFVPFEQANLLKFPNPPQNNENESTDMDDSHGGPGCLLEWT